MFLGPDPEEEDDEDEEEAGRKLQLTFHYSKLTSAVVYINIYPECIRLLLRNIESVRFGLVKPDLYEQTPT